MSENSKPDFFIKIINLDRRKDRMDAMMKNIAETCFSQYPIERFSAIKPNFEDSKYEIAHLSWL